MTLSGPALAKEKCDILDPKSQSAILAGSIATLRRNLLTSPHAIVEFISGFRHTFNRYEVASKDLNDMSRTVVRVTSDRQQVVKEYVPGSILPLHEILATRFLISRGLIVARVIDYSRNVLVRDDRPIIVVKEYIEGLNDKNIKFDVNYDLTAQYAELETQAAYYRSVFKDFRSWVETQPEGPLYLELLAASGANTRNTLLAGDFKKENWLLTAVGGWILIDP